MHTQHSLTDTYQLVASDVSLLIAQARVSAEIIVLPSGSTPAPSDLGFAFRANEPQAIPNVGILGGYVWARGKGFLITATDV